MKNTQKQQPSRRSIIEEKRQHQAQSNDFNKGIIEFSNNQKVERKISDFDIKYPEDDDDDIVQRSSILSFQESKDCEIGKRRLGQALVGTFEEAQRQQEEQDSKDPIILQRELKQLRTAIAELYLGIKQKTKDENEQSSVEEDAEEREIIMSLDSYVIIEYIKSSVDIILNLKFEEIEKRLLDKNHNGSVITQGGGGQDQEESRNEDNDTLREVQRLSKVSNNNQKGKAKGNNLENDNSLISNSERSNMSEIEGPPKVYEELIQNLEADIRKHIRIEQQLKLHIESMENRIEELENINEKIEGEKQKLKKTSSQKNKEIDQRIKEFEDKIKTKDEVLQSHEKAIEQMRENEIKFRNEIEKLKAQIIQQSNTSVMNQNKILDPFSIINQATENISRTQEVGNIQMNKTQPMIIKQNSIAMADQLNVQQLRKYSQNPDFGSCSSNNSFLEPNGSPIRRTPEITHPYLHQTQMIKKKKTGTPGTTTKHKKFVPNSVAESLGLHPSFNQAISTYSSTGQSGKVIGNRKFSTQQTRNNQAQKNLQSLQKNSWIGQINNPCSFTGANQILPQPQFSNIINNNIQGLSINYSNQIIQNADPVQQFANNFLSMPKNTVNGSNVLQEMVVVANQDSDSSNLNSHRRCKSQNVKRDNKGEKIASSQIGKNVIERKKKQIISDVSREELLQNQINEAFQMQQNLRNKKADNFRSIGNKSSLIEGHTNDNFFENTVNFDQNVKAIKQNNQHNKESKRANAEFSESQNQKRTVKNASSFNSHTLSGQNTQKMRTVSNRIQQINGSNGIDDLSKNRFNQSYGGGGIGHGNSMIIGQKIANHNSISCTNPTQHSRSNNNNMGSAAVQSIEKPNVSKSRNNLNKGLIQNNTVGGRQPSYHAKFDNGLMDMNFKTTLSTSNQQQKNVTANVQHIPSFQMIQRQQSSSATNNQIFQNQTNIQMLKQQIIAQKKASNLLMKGLSPLKRQ